MTFTIWRLPDCQACGASSYIADPSKDGSGSFCQRCGSPLPKPVVVPSLPFLCHECGNVATHYAAETPGDTICVTYCADHAPAGASMIDGKPDADSPHVVG